MVRGDRQTRASPMLWCALGLGILAAIAGVFGLALGRGGGDRSLVYLSSALTVSFLPLAASALVRLPWHPLTTLLTCSGSLAAIAVAAHSWSGQSAVASWLGEWLWWPAVPLILLILLALPGSGVPTRGLRLRVLGVALASFTVTIGLAVQRWWDPLLRLGDMAVAVSAIAGVAILVSSRDRWRRADPLGRRRRSSVAAGAVVTLLALTACVVSDNVFAQAVASLVATAALPLGLGTAVLRYRLYDLDLVINRTIVWTLLSGLVLMAYLALLAVLSPWLPMNSPAAALVTTGLLVLGFEPARRRVQRGVDHVLYGEGHNPYRVLNRLGGDLARSAEITDGLPLIAQTVCTTLRLPYVGIEVLERDGPAAGRSVIATEYGRLVTEPERFPMRIHGEAMGTLLAAPRRAGERFTTRECRLLRSLARQAAAVVQTARLLGDLQLSRERLVLAREEERRRLRHDLHDGVGPALAGARFQLTAALRLVADSPEKTAALLERVTDDLHNCALEVRRVISGLRPAALDDGLGAALDSEGARFSGPGLHVTVSTDAAATNIPAAVEVAAYRIVSEALTNVARHSGADTCSVSVRRVEGQLLVVIEDNGQGVAEDAVAGVGLDSIRRRAEELGGSAQVTVVEPSGTRVTARLPVGSGQAREVSSEAPKPSGDGEPSTSDAGNLPDSDERPGIRIPDAAPVLPRPVRQQSGSVPA